MDKSEDMKYQSNVKKNYIFSTMYQILMMISPLITTPYIARVFGTTGVGRYSMVNTVALYFLQFAMMGISTYGNRNIAFVRDDEKTMNKVFTEIYAAQLSLCTISVAAYLIYSVFMPVGERSLVYIHIIYVLSAVFDVSWMFYGIEKIDTIVVINSIDKILTIILIFTFVKDINDIWIYTLIMCSGTFMNTFIAWMIAFKHVKFVKVKPADIRQRYLPLIILFIPVIASSVYKTMDKLMLGLITDADDLVGLYNNSEQLIGMPQGLITAIGLVMLPRIANQVAAGNKEKSRNEIRVSMRFINFLSVAITFGIASIAPEFVPLFLGESFAQCVQYVIMLAPGNLFVSWGYSIRNQYLIPCQKDKIYVTSIITGAVINFVINLTLIKQLGIYGAIIGTIVAEAVVAAWQTFAVRKEIDVQKYLTDTIPFIFSALLMSFVIRVLGRHLGVHIYTVLIEIILGGCVYMLFSIGYMYFFEKDNLIRYIHFILGNGGRKR